MKLTKLDLPKSFSPPMGIDGGICYISSGGHHRIVQDKGTYDKVYGGENGHKFWLTAERHHIYQVKSEQVIEIDHP